MMAKTNPLRALVVLVAVALAASLLVVVAPGKPAQASFPGPNGLIAFVSDRDSTGEEINDDIYVTNESGAKPIRLTNNSAIDQWPAVSPNGKEIAFASNRNGQYDIYVMDAKDEVNNVTGAPGSDENGDNLRPLTNDPAYQIELAWSPDGKKIAFRSNQDGNDEVYMMPTDGSETPTRLTKTPTGQFDGNPVFSPDGSKIAFTSNRPDPTDTTTDQDIWVMKPESESAANVPLNLTKTPTGQFDGNPEFSPDGSKIAFTSNRPVPTDGTRDQDIWVMNADGSDQKNLTGNRNFVEGTTTPLYDRWPAWSPDGKKIAFWSGGGNTGLQPDSDIWVMDADGSDQKPITAILGKLVGDIQPDWGPDTTKPEITLRTPAESDTYTLNQSVTADYECADEGGSGLASCEGDVPDGASIDTSSVGDKTFTVTAKDNAGNTNSVTHNYRVVYDFKGFFDPVDNPPTLNSAKAGSAIPVKFSLSGDQGLDVLAEGYPKSQEISCDSAAQVNGVEETATASESGLTYDASTDQYTYVWKTDKAWAGTCRQLVVKLKDGTEYKANFELR